MPDTGLRAAETLRPGGGREANGPSSDDAAGFSRAISRDGGSPLRPGDARLERSLPPAWGEDATPGPLPGRRGRPSRRGRTDGGALWPIGRTAPVEGPRFDVAVPPGGYRWWYVDAISDDGRFGITLIAFIGSVFSPYYLWSGRGNPLDHCAVNVAVYGPGRPRWAMTERRRAKLRQAEHTLQIGPSTLEWEGGVLTARFDEITAPLPSRVKGMIRLHPQAVLGETYGLDVGGRHHWRPIAPRCTVELALDEPACAWRGQGYFDTNAGAEPLEHGFTAWNWSRAHLESETLLSYDVERRDGEPAHVALRIDRAGVAEVVEPQPTITLPSTFWRMPRRVRGDPSDPPQLVRTLEDTPFYARSAMQTGEGGGRATIMHESLSLDRLRSPAIRAMLPFRMPRVFW